MFYEYKNDLCCKFTKNEAKYHVLGILLKSLTLLVVGPRYKSVRAGNKKRLFSDGREKRRLRLLFENKFFFVGMLVHMDGASLGYLTCQYQFAESVFHIVLNGSF